MTKQAKLPTASLLLALTAAMQTAENIRLDNVELIDRIKAEGQKQVAAKNAADDAKTGKSGLWGDCVSMAEIVAANVPATEREMVFTLVLRDILEGEGTNTAKMYASTAKRVLTVLHTDQGKEFSELREASYAEIQKMLKPDLNPEFTQRYTELVKQLKYVGRKAEKAASLELLAKLEDEVGKAYRPLKAASDAKTAAAKAAAELESNKQQAPETGAVVETVAKQEAQA